MEKLQSAKGDILIRINECAALVLTLNYILFRFLETTTFRFSFSEQYHAITYALLVLTGTVRVLFMTCTEYNAAENKREKAVCVLKVLLIILLSVPFFTVAQRFGYTFLAYLPWVAISLYGIDGEKVLKALTYSIGILLLSVVVCALTGAIDNYLYIGKRSLRGSYGIGYPTDFASYFVYLLLFIWCLQKKNSLLQSTLLACFGILVAYISYYYAGSNTSTICGILFAVTALFEGIEYRYFSHRKADRYFQRIVNGFAVSAFPLLGFSFVGLTLLYGSGNRIAAKFNTLLTNRLQLSWKYLQKYGIQAFGALTPQIGSGGGDFRSNEYEFIDNSFFLLLIRYGWIIALVISVIWVWMTWKMLKTGRRRWALAMALIAIHSFSEHHFPEVNYNALLAMPLCCYPLMTDSNADKQSRMDKTDTRKRFRLSEEWIPRITGLVLLFLGVLLLPKSLSWFRALFAVNGWTGGGEASLPALILCIICVLLLAGLWFLLTRKVIPALLTKKKVAVSDLAKTVAVVCLMIAGVIWTKGQVDRNFLGQRDRFEADAKAIGVILSSAEEPVYAGDAIEESYQRCFSGISGRIWSAEEICRPAKGTIILDKDYEATKLLDKGAVYAELSEYSGVYTFDEKAAKALQKAGFTVHGFYSSGRDVDLERMASVSGVEMIEEGTIPLGGENKTLVYGPYMSQYRGRYLVTYDLSLDPAGIQDDQLVCVLRVTGDSGQDTYGVKEVYSSEFDENGHLDASISYELKQNVDNLEYPVYEWNNARLTVNRISWKRNPKSDIRRKYYMDGLVSKIQYYSLDGEPLQQSKGQYGVVYEYNHIFRKPTLIQYLDENGDLTKITDGYAQVSRTYNDWKQIEEECYLDENGKLCLSTQNYAINRRKYDNNSNLIQQSFFDTNGKPVLNANGYALIRKEYDKENRIIRQEYLDEAGKPIILSAGQCAEEYEYDNSGNKTVIRYLGSDGKLVMVSKGYAEIHRVYNEWKQKTHESYYDAEGKACMLSDGYAALDLEYDELGNVNYRKYYDSDDRPVLIKNGYAEIHRVFNADKRIIKELYYDAEGNPFPLSKGQYGVEYDYDENGNKTLIRYLGANERPILIKDGYAELHRVYNNRNQIVEESYFDADGKQMLISPGYTKIVYEYTEDQGLSLLHFLDLNGNEIEAGSAYLHKYLQSLSGRDLIIFISAKDDASKSLTVTLAEDMKALGLRMDLRGQYQASYYAVIQPGDVQEKLSKDSLELNGTIGDIPFTIISSGHSAGNISSILIGGEEYSRNTRGLNIVLFDPETKSVTESIAFDTYARNMRVTR